MERDWKDLTETEEEGNFNSHAHVERDNREFFLYNTDTDFNSHAHVERDCFWQKGI